MTTRAVNSRAPFVWWLHPGYLLGCSTSLIAIAAYVIAEDRYRSYWRTPKFFDLEALLISLACAAVFAAGSLLGSQLMARLPSGPVPDSGDRGFIEKLFTLSFWLCVAGYTLWAGLAIQRGLTLSTLVGGLAGGKGAM